MRDHSFHHPILRHLCLTAGFACLVQKQSLAGPTANHEYALELINRLRAAPTAELEKLVIYERAGPVGFSEVGSLDSGD